MLKGIDNFQAFDYNAYNRIRNDQYNADLRKQTGDDNKAAAASAQAPIELDLRLDDIRPRKNADLEDVSLSLSDHGAFEMKGRQSDIDSLDMEKAVSDMQKDQALMQYQYFVGESNLINSEDGIVIRK